MSDQSGAQPSGDVFNTFPELSDEELARKAVVLKAQLFQVVGELVRRPDVPGDNPKDVEDAVGSALQEVILYGYLSGQFASEHDVLQVVIDGGGSLKGTVFDDIAEENVLQTGDHALSTDCPCGPEVESFAAEAAKATEVSAR